MLNLVNARVLAGDALEALRSLPDESVHCIATSPPYWGLRDYGTASWEGGDPGCSHRVGGQVQDGKAPGAIVSGVRPGADASRCLSCGARRVDQQLGLEPTPEEYVSRMVEIFREVRRVMRDDGTLWLNLGDSYASNGGHSDVDHADRRAAARIGNRPGNEYRSFRQGGGDLKPKDLFGIPWRVAFALQTDGWYLRSDIIWAKPNPMPESVRDRPTKSHEYLFLLTKSPRYYFDQEAVREPYESTRDRGRPDGAATYESFGVNSSCGTGGSGRNVRSVWTIATQPFPEAHFATFPPELPRRCILAGTSERGCCTDCGAPWERLVKRSGVNVSNEEGIAAMIDKGVPRRTANLYVTRDRGTSSTIGWTPTCYHYDPRYRTDFPQSRRARKRHQRDLSGDWWRRVRRRPGRDDWPTAPAVVLDPFSGSGTTGMVAALHGRNFIGVELNDEYARMAARRIGGAAPLWVSCLVENAEESPT